MPHKPIFVKLAEKIKNGKKNSKRIDLYVSRKH